MKNNKNIELDRVIGTSSIVIMVITLIIAILNIYIKDRMLTGVVYGIDLIIMIFNLIRLKVSEKNFKIEFDEFINKYGPDNNYGFREDFSWETRFDLKTEVNGYIVSTVDLGIDYSFCKGEPLYYETMIFDKNGDTLDGFQARYSTKQQAKKGHKKAIEYVKSMGNENDRTKTN